MSNARGGPRAKGWYAAVYAANAARKTLLERHADEFDELLRFERQKRGLLAVPESKVAASKTELLRRIAELEAAKEEATA